MGMPLDWKDTEEDASQDLAPFLSIYISHHCFLIPNRWSSTGSLLCQWLPSPRNVSWESTLWDEFDSMDKTSFSPEIGRYIHDRRSVPSQYNRPYPLEWGSRSGKSASPWNQETERAQVDSPMRCPSWWGYSRFEGYSDFLWSEQPLKNGEKRSCILVLEGKMS